MLYPHKTAQQNRVHSKAELLRILNNMKGAALQIVNALSRDCLLYTSRCTGRADPPLLSTLCSPNPHTQEGASAPIDLTPCQAVLKIEVFFSPPKEMIVPIAWVSPQLSNISDAFRLSENRVRMTSSTSSVSYTHLSWIIFRIH